MGFQIHLEFADQQHHASHSVSKNIPHFYVKKDGAFLPESGSTLGIERPDNAVIIKREPAVVTAATEISSGIFLHNV